MIDFNALNNEHSANWSETTMAQLDEDTKILQGMGWGDTTIQNAILRRNGISIDEGYTTKKSVVIAIHKGYELRYT